MENKRKDSNGRILRKGESQRSDLSYMYRWTDKNKERQCIYDITLNGLREQEDIIEKDIINGVARSNITLSTQIEKYLNVKSSLASTTSENYWYYYKKDIKSSEIGKSILRNLVKSDFLKFYKQKFDGDDYSNGTIHILHKIIHPSLQLAVDDGILAKNPSDNCMKEYPEKAKEKYALSFEEEMEFLKRFKESKRRKRYYPMIAIILYSGIRISEALGLTWGDVDMNKRVIDINHQLQYRKICGETKFFCIDPNHPKSTKRTKSDSGMRIIPMNDKLYEFFVEQRKEWFKINKDTDFSVDGYSDFIFLSHVTGRPMYHANVRRMVNEIVDLNNPETMNLPHITPHILRHTACTRYLEAGMDVKTVQYLMGHSDVRTTMETYNHINMERVLGELKKLDKLQNSYTKIYTKFV